MASSAGGEDDRALRLGVKNTFLHAADRTVIQAKIQRSHSDGALGSVSSDSSVTSARERPRLTDGDDDDMRSDATGSSQSHSSQAIPFVPYTSEVGTENGSNAQEDSSDAQQNSLRLHSVGKCRPCIYFNSSEGCLNGSTCRFCHMEHTRKSRPRPCKAKRIQCKQTIALMQAVYESDPQAFALASENLSSQSDYMRSLLGGQQQQSQVPSTSSRTSGTSSSYVDPQGTFANDYDSESTSGRSCGSRNSRNSRKNGKSGWNQKVLVAL